MFAEDWIYAFGLLDELAINAYWTERYVECVAVCDRLLDEGKIPAHERDRVLKNKQFAVDKLAKDTRSRPSGNGRCAHKSPKIAVYTIALNESQHSERWAKSVADADYRVVLDTGSTDDTVARFRGCGVTVREQKITPWRFDQARNAALAAVPEDAEICVSMDMDEFLAPGWRAEMERAWVAGETTRLQYSYVFDYDANGANASYPMNKIHARRGYIWKRPVHENVWPTGPGEKMACNLSVVLNQLQDRPKNTRSNYLPLLKLAHDEDSADHQVAFWYGRELMYTGHHAESAVVLQRYLDMESAPGRPSEARP